MPAKRTAKQASTIAHISVDLGNAYSNLMADNAIAADWRSIQGLVSDNNRINELPFDSVIKFNNRWYVFGDATRTLSANVEDFPTTERYTSAWYKRLFAYALHRAYGLRLSESPFYPKVVASVPAREFANEKRVEKIKANLAGGYVIGNVAGGTLQVDVTADNLTIIPEGAGTYFYMLDKGDTNGRTLYASGLWAVLDIGFLTADIVAFRNGDYMPDISTSDPRLGIRFVADKVARFVRGEGGPDLDPSEFDEMLMCDSIVLNGSTYTIKETREKALNELGEGIGRLLQKEFSNSNVGGIMLTGGGGGYLTNRIKANNLPGIVLVPDPRRANVEGGFKLLED